MALSEQASLDERRSFTSRYAVEMCFSDAALEIRGPQRLLWAKEDDMARRQWKSWDIC